MRTTDAYSETEPTITTTTPTTTTREPQPPYNHDGEMSSNSASSFSETAQSTGQDSTAERISRPVTAATARRRRLWEKGTLILEDPFGAYRVTEITEDWAARTEPNDPELEPQAFELFPERTLVFATSSNAVKDPKGTEGHAQLDEIDTKHALWHLRSALEDAECIDARPLLKMGIKRDLQRAERILSNHARRNGFNA